MLAEWDDRAAALVSLASGSHGVGQWGMTQAWR